MQGIMSGLKPAVVGLIAGAAVTVAAAIFAPASGNTSWIWWVLLTVMLGVSFKWKKLHPIVIICICALVGILVGYLGI